MRPNSNIQGTFLEKINIKKSKLDNAMFIDKISTKTASSVFHQRFQRPSHSYPTNFLESNYSLPAHNLKT